MQCCRLKRRKDEGYISKKKGAESYTKGSQICFFSHKFVKAKLNAAYFFVKLLINAASFHYYYYLFLVESGLILANSFINIKKAVDSPCF